MKKKKGLAEATKKLYGYVTSKFLGFQKYVMPDQEPSLWYVWDEKLCSLFFDLIRPAVPPNSLTNFYSGLACVRLYMKLTGNRPDDYMDLFSNFAMEASVAQKERSKYIAAEKAKSTKEKGILGHFFLGVYRKAENWADFHALIERLKAASDNVRVTSSELTMATGLLVCALTASNSKRAGNYALIEAEPAFKSLNQAYADFKFRFPDDDLSCAPKRLDRRRCVPAIIEIPVSSKVGRAESMCVLSPVDQLALLDYHRYIRKHAPTEVTTTKFFFNRKGQSLGKDVCFFLQKMTKKAGINTTFNTLRRAVETENVLNKSKPGSSEPSSSAAVTSHLGHSESSAEKYYRIQDNRHVVQGSSETLRLFEEVGLKSMKPTERNDSVKTLWDQQVFSIY